MNVFCRIPLCIILTYFTEKAVRKIVPSVALMLKIVAGRLTVGGNLLWDTIVLQRLPLLVTHWCICVRFAMIVRWKDINSAALWTTVSPCQSHSFACIRLSLMHIFMAALRSRCGHYIFVRFLLSFFFFSSLNLNGHRVDVDHTSTHGVALVRI